MRLKPYEQRWGPSIGRFQFITQDLPDFSHVQQVQAACAAGVKWIQLRVKNQPTEEWLKIATEAQKVCRKHGATYIINDNVSIAKIIKADGIHLGKTDMHPAQARAILGRKALIGGTANTFEDIQRLAEFRVDYIGLGPLRFTPTKSNLSPELGIEGYHQIMTQVKGEGIWIPIVAIGGVVLSDLLVLPQTQVHGIAVTSAITQSEDPAATLAQWVKVMQKASF